MRFSAPTSIAILLALAASSTAAQVPPPTGQLPSGPGRITGLVTDLEGQPLVSVGVTLRSATDSALVTGAMTGSDGRFRIDGLVPGRYLLRVSFIGYKPRNSEVIEITPADPVRNLGTITLEVSPVELDAVEADAERSAVVIEADRTVYNTKAMPLSSTGTATDVLRAVPELEVDVNNNVKLRGNQDVAVHINGRPAPLRGEQLANFLQQLPGNRIDRVEVMPNPSARHDPEGMGGIVNIVLKEDLDLGLSGSVSANSSTRNNHFVNGRLNYQRGRLTFFTGAGMNMNRGRSTAYDLRRNLVTVPVSLIEQSTRSENDGRGWNLDWTAELKVGRQATLWSNAWMFSHTSDQDGLTEYGILSDDRVAWEQYDRDNEAEFSFGNYNVGVGFKQVFQPQKEELTVDGRWSTGGNDNSTRQVRLYHILSGQPADVPPQLTLNDIDGDNGNISIQADYFRPLGSAKLELGYRAWKRTNDNDNHLNVYDAPTAIDPSHSARGGYAYDEVFHSIYGTYGRTLGKFTAQVGLRAELTNTMFDSRVTDASFDRDYNTLFPSFNIAYTPKPGRTVRFLYSKRISRPPPFYLDPFVPPTDPLNRFFGNPDLRPSYTQSYSLDFSYSGSRGTIRVAPYYRYSTDIWERIRTVDADGVATSRWENAASGENYGSNFTLSLRPAGRLSGSVNVSVYRDVRDGSNIASGYRRAALMTAYGGNLGLKVTSGLTAQAYANHFPAQSILQGKASGYTFMSMALRQQVWGTKGSVSLSIMDPLKLNNYTSSTRDPTHVQQSRSSFSSRVATLGVTYNFGKPPQQQSRRSGGEENTGETIRVR
jgi:hypothetical protein